MLSNKAYGFLITLYRGLYSKYIYDVRRTVLLQVLYSNVLYLEYDSTNTNLLVYFILYSNYSLNCTKRGRCKTGSECGCM